MVANVSLPVVQVWCGLVWEAELKHAFDAVARCEVANSVQSEQLAGVEERGRCESRQVRVDAYVYRRDEFEVRCRRRWLLAAGGCP